MDGRRRRRKQLPFKLPTSCYIKILPFTIFRHVHDYSATSWCTNVPLHPRTSSDRLALCWQLNSVRHICRHCNQLLESIRYYDYIIVLLLQLDRCKADTSISRILSRQHLVTTSVRNWLFGWSSLYTWQWRLTTHSGVTPSQYGPYHYTNHLHLNEMCWNQTSWERCFKNFGVDISECFVLTELKYF